MKIDNFKGSIKWSTERLDQWYEMYNNGEDPGDTPWLNNMIDVKKPNLPFEYTKDELTEYMRCVRETQSISQRISPKYFRDPRAIGRWF